MPIPKRPGSLLFVALLATVASCASAHGRAPGQPVEDARMQQMLLEFRREPDAPPQRWLNLIGVYGPDTLHRWYALERDQRMWILDQNGNYVPLTEQNDSVFQSPLSPVPVSGEVRFHRDSSGRATSVQVGNTIMPRRAVEPAAGVAQLKITPVGPVDSLRRAALAATPPVENGSFRVPELVELTKLDSTIKLDIRYATSNNFLGTPIYEKARAFMQAPAAQALVKASKTLKPFGYGLLIHDAYRPWYVTKIFWDATPPDLHWLVANPAEGSKHNRGEAVDLTLYELETGNPVEMPSTYDESTERAHADYPGGTSRQRWHRALLRRVMQEFGFVPNPLEWWHFDYKDWQKYPIMNVPFDSVRTR
jgi:D-alanyl-D-alanine dipeptidase